MKTLFKFFLLAGLCGSAFAIDAVKKDISGPAGIITESFHVAATHPLVLDDPGSLSLGPGIGGGGSSTSLGLSLLAISGALPAGVTSAPGLVSASGGTFGTSAFLDATPTYTTVNNPITSPTAITALTYKLLGAQSMIFLQPENFIEVRCDFDADQMDTTQTTISGTYSSSITKGDYTFTNSSGGASAVLAFKRVPSSPTVSVSARIDSLSGASATYDVAGVGLVKNATNWLVGAYSLSTSGGKVSILQNNAGTITELGAVSKTLAAGSTIMFIKNGKFGSVFTNEGKGWEQVVTAVDTSGLGLTTATTLAQYTYGIVTTATGGSVAMGAFRGGQAGTYSTSDLTLVTYEDGSPIEIGNCVYLLGDEHIPGGGVGQPLVSPVTVYQFNTTTHEITPVSRFNFIESGVFVAHRSGHLVYDRTQKRFVLVMAQWELYNVSTMHLVYGYYRENLLSGIWNLSNMTVMTGINPATSVYDPFICKISGVWYVAFTAAGGTTSWSSFYPGLSSGADLEHLSLVGTDPTHDQYEGSRIQKVGNTYYVCYAVISTPHCIAYNLGLNVVGTWDISITTQNPAHPTIIPVHRNGSTVYQLLTFDTIPTPSSTQWSNIKSVLLYESNQTVAGYEWPLTVSFAAPPPTRQEPKTGAGSAGGGSGISADSSFTSSRLGFKDALGTISGSSLLTFDGTNLTFGGTGDFSRTMTGGSTNRERFFKFKTSDGGNNLGFLFNGTSANSAFIASYGGYGDSASQTAVSFSGLALTANEGSRTAAIVSFSAYLTNSVSDPINGVLTGVTNTSAPMFEWGTVGAAFMRMLGDGRLLLASSNPTADGTGARIQTDTASISSNLFLGKTIIAAGTTGDQTINKLSGQVNFAAGASTLTVTNSLAASTSIIHVQVLGSDATAFYARVTKAAGSFAITLNAAATAETAVEFTITN